MPLAQIRLPQIRKGKKSKKLVVSILPNDSEPVSVNLWRTKIQLIGLAA
jgi:hypothetical protein